MFFIVCSQIIDKAKLFTQLMKGANAMLEKGKRTYFKKPRYPDYPYSEWRARIKKVQALMSEKKMGCLVLWENENIRYFFGFQTIHWFMKSIQPAVGIVPVAGEPILIVPDLFMGNAEGLCWVDDIRVQVKPHQPKSQRELPVEVANIIKEIGCGNKNIGLEMGPLGCMYIPRPLNDIYNFKEALPDANFVNGDELIWNCRMIKSSLEIERITKSIAGITAVELAIVEGYRPGMTEIDLLKIINTARAQQDGNCLGHDAIAWSELICDSRKRRFSDIMALEKAVIAKGDTILFDGVFYYKGYTPDSARMWQTGEVTKEAKKYYEIIFKAEDNIEVMLKPGVKAKDVYNALYEPVLSAGFKASDMGGHGTGLDCHEPPSIDAWNEMIIQENMTLSIEPWMILKNEESFGIQDTFLVTDTGCVKIEGLRRSIIQVSHPIL
jgi:Xaa-Pro dipeptidase